MRAKETLFEYYEDDSSDEFSYVSSADDNTLDKYDRGTTRKRPRLTLQHLNKMRKLKKLKRQEKIKHLETVARMYGNKSEE